MAKLKLTYSGIKDMKSEGEPKWDTEYSTDDFQEIVEYVKIKEQENKIKVIRIKDLFE